MQNLYEFKMKNYLFFLFIILSFIPIFAQKSKEKQNEEIAQQFTDVAAEGNVDKIKSMLANGVNVNTEPKDFQGWTALMAAATNGQTEAVKYLIAQGANVKVKLKDGETTLYQSAQDETIKKLLRLY